MPTAPTPLPTIPPFPVLADKATGTYNSKAYDWATGWDEDIAPAIEALADNAYDNAVEGAASAVAAAASASTATTQAGTATTQASAASASAVAAAASASTATNAANVQGTSTSSVAMPTANGQSKSFTYVESSRAIAVGMFLLVAVTASPTTNWMLLQVSAWDSGTRVVTGTVITYGGSGTHAAWTLSLSSARGAAGADATVTMPSLALTGTPTLVNGNNGYTGDVAAGAAIALDTLSTLGDGWSMILDPASTTNPGRITADYGSGSEARSLAGPTIISVKNVSGTYTVRWMPLGNNVPVFGSLGTPAVLSATTPTHATLSICAISATRSIGIHSLGGIGTPRPVLINSSTGAVVSAGAAMDASALSGATMQVVRIDDTNAVAIWAISGAVKAVVLSNVADFMTVGTPITIEAVSSTCQAIAVQASGKILCVYSNTSAGSLRGTILTLSGTTLSATTLYTLFATVAPSQVRVAALSATQSLVTFNHSSAANFTVALPLTEASNVLTFPAAPDTIYKASASNTTGNSDVCAMTSNMAVVVAGVGRVNGADAAAMTVTVSGTGASAKLQVGPQRPITTPSAITSGHRLAKINSAMLLHLCTVDATNVTSTVQALYVEGDAVRAGAAKNVARNVGQHDIAYTSANRLVAQATYTDADNSSYPTAVVIDLGSLL